MEGPLAELEAGYACQKLSAQDALRIYFGNKQSQTGVQAFQSALQSNQVH